MKRKITFTAAMFLFAGIVCGQMPGLKSSENSYATGGYLLNKDLLSENFETWPPAGWTFIGNNWLHGETGNLFFLWDVWSVGGVTTPLGGGKFVSMVSGSYEDQASWMISPSLVIRTGDILSFWVNRMPGTQYLEIMVSQTNNSIYSFTESIGSYNYNDLAENQWIKIKLGLSKYEGKTIYIAWKITVNGMSYFMTDMVRVGPALISDAALLLYQPPDYVPAGEFVISGTILNQGSGSITQADVSWQVDYGPIYTERFQGFSVAEDQGYQFACQDKYVTSPGNHTLKVGIAHVNGLGADENPGNDTIKSSFYACSNSAPKMHLFEVFTNSGCGGCPILNRNVIEPETQKHNGKVAVVKYQTSWPNSQDYCIPETGIRGGYYGGIGWVPYFFVDGVTSYYLMDIAPQDASIAYIDSLFMLSNDQRAVVEIKSGHAISQSTKNIELNATITPYFSGTGYRTFVCVVEKTTTGNAVSNEEPEFYSVLMKMLPDAQGILMNFVEGIPNNIHLSANLSGTYIEEFSDLAVVLFVQNTNTKKVIQAAYSEEITTDSSNGSLPEKDIRVYPNPSHGIVNISDACGADLEICDITGRVLYSVKEADCLEEVDLAGFKKGIYLLKITEGERISFHKVLLN